MCSRSWNVLALTFRSIYHSINFPHSIHMLAQLVPDIKKLMKMLIYVQACGFSIANRTNSCGQVMLLSVKLPYYKMRGKKAAMLVRYCHHIH